MARRGSAWLASMQAEDGKDKRVGPVLPLPPSSLRYFSFYIIW